MNKKLIITVLTVLLVGVANTLYSQEPVGNKAPLNYQLQDNLEPTENYQYLAGDTIIIHKEKETYLTGEKISNWVYYVKHTIYSVGGKRFPEGVLINGIMSWVAPEDLYLAGSITPESEAAKAKRKADQAAAQKQMDEMPEDVKELIESGKISGVEAPAEKTDETPVEQPVDTMTEAQPTTPMPIIVQEDKTEPVEIEKEEKTKKDSYNRLTIGLRGGVGSHMHNAPVMGNWKAGYTAMLDLQYAHYWESNKKNAYGIIVGVSAGYAESGIANGVDTAYTVGGSGSDPKVNYTISASDIKEQDGMIQVEIPIMFSVIAKNGLFFNVGPKIALPAFNLYRQNIAQPNIRAEFPEMGGVVVENEAITGLVQDDQMKTNGKWNGGKLSVRIGAEIGYEWKLKNGHSLGLGAYGTFSAFNLRDNITNGANSLINVAPPSATGPADVTVNSATDTYAIGTGYFDAGVKIAYHFNLKPKKAN